MTDKHEEENESTEDVSDGQDSDESEQEEFTSVRDIYEDVVDNADDDSSDVTGTGFFNPMEMLATGDTTGGTRSEGVDIAVRLVEAGGALNDFVDYLDKNDIDVAELDQREMMNLEYEQMAVVFGFIAMNDGMQSLREHFEDDDDDDNPFKVSGGDDPIY